MEAVPFPPKPAPLVTASEAVFLVVMLLFFAVVCIWPVLAGHIHHFSTWTRDAVHSYPVHEHGATFYLQPTLGKFYVSLPWLWGSLLAATFLTGFLTDRKRGSRK